MSFFIEVFLQTSFFVLGFHQGVDVSIARTHLEVDSYRITRHDG